MAVAVVAAVLTAVAVVVLVYKCKYHKDHSLGGRCGRHTGMRVRLGTDVVQLDNVSALAAALERAVTRDLSVEPN